MFSICILLLQLDIYDAAQRYKQEGTPLIILTGRDYGSGSSRDWAAKGPYLLGVRAVIAESYERIHRSNLVGMGIIPFQFLPDQSAQSLKLTGKEVYEFDIPSAITPRQVTTVKVRVFAIDCCLSSQVNIWKAPAFLFLAWWWSFVWCYYAIRHRSGTRVFSTWWHFALHASSNA